ncbi:MAG: hypothetical protein ACM3O8_03120 [Methylococcaceae bacterium]|nr:hypothetical protein [Prolixibacteraceae bacterium]
MKRRIIFVILNLLFLGNYQLLIAQQVKVKASIDSTHMLIGDQIKLNLEIEKPSDMEIQFPVVPDTLNKNIEVVKKLPLDTFKIKDKDRIRLTQSYLISSFDSGRHVIPAFTFIMKHNNMKDSISTNALNLEVMTMKLDTTKGPVDIKTPYGAPVTLSEVTPYILGTMLLGAILFFIFYYVRWKKKNVPMFVKPEKPKDPAHVIALRELDRIKTQKLWQQEKIKQYYSEVADTVRNYIQDRFGIPAMEQTSAETIMVFKDRKELINNDCLNEVQHILSLADLVKFAKYTPLPDDNNQTLMNAYFFVNQTKQEESVKTAEKPSMEVRGEEEVAV